jgi:cell division protein FtsI (penicillin-binding protein 3)
MSIHHKKISLYKNKDYATHESSGKNAKTKTSGRTGQLYQLAFCVAVRLHFTGAGFPAGSRGLAANHRPDMLVRQGDMRSLRVQEVSTARGMITDRSGRPLAVSVPVKAIWADPKELHDAGGITLDNRWKALADALKMPLDQLASRINTNPKGRFIYLARQVNPDMADYIKTEAAGDSSA